MKAFKITIIAFLVISGNSCEKVIDIDIPDSERKIVVNGLINPDSLVKVNISRSLSVLEDNEFVFLETAIVKLFKSDAEIGELSFLGSGNYILPNYYPQDGSEYTLQVDYDGLKSVSATTNIYKPIEFSEMDTSSTFNEWGGSNLEVDFSFSDPEDQNFYAIGVNVSHKLYDWETDTNLDSIITYPAGFQFLESQDGIQGFMLDEGATTYYGDKVFFSDEFFNGQDFNVSLGLWKGYYGADTVNLEVYLEHVSKPYYYYAVSSGKYRSSNGNPFSEAVSVYTNVENGFGIFSGYSSFRRKIVLLGERGK